MHLLCDCDLIVYITYIPMYISLCPSMVYILYSHQIMRAKFVLSINTRFLLVESSSIEPLVDWERHDMFYGLVELPQDQVVFHNYD